MWADMMLPGGRVYGGSEMAAILHGGGIPPEAIDALLTSASISTSFGGPLPMMNLESVCGSTTPDRHPAYTTTMVMTNDSDLDECGFFQQHLHPNPSDPKKRRLSPDQVQFLERSFEEENKLEPERKVELARSLGLQPRQVAIWFQNRRARWKTKQLEQDYEVVRQGYEMLKREYEATKEEKEKLEAEVNYLREQLSNRQKRRRSGGVGIIEVPDEKIPPEGPASSVTREMKVETGSGTGAARTPKEEPAETDRSELSHADDADFDGVVAAAAAAAAAACRYEFPATVDDHHSLWLWQQAEFCGP